VAVRGEAGMETAKGKAKALQGMLGETISKGTVESKETGPVVKKRVNGGEPRAGGSRGGSRERNPAPGRKVGSHGASEGCLGR